MRIQIQLYNVAFPAFPPLLQEFATLHQIPLPNINTLRGQALALMSQPDVCGQQYICREDATVFFEKLGMKSQDVIQPFNKAFGIKRMKLSKGQYCLEFPFINDRVHLDKRVNVQIDIVNRDRTINEIKSWWRNNVMDVPNEEWHIGHLDPTVAQENNVVFQPPIQARYRDRFKWDAKFFKMWPTGKELIQHFDTYYTEDEKKEILEYLVKRT